MERVAFKMQLKEGFEAEYKKRHDEIWPELKVLLKEAGIYDYSIFLDSQTHALFAIQKKKDGNVSQQISADPIMRKWWDHMADIMEVNSDNSPVCIELSEVFHLD
ncbi:MAG: L-rhamnose mutarotase [Sphaerochaetaceae bacterium]